MITQHISMVFECQEFYEKYADDSILLTLTEAVHENNGSLGRYGTNHPNMAIERMRTSGSGPDRVTEYGTESFV